MTMALDFVIYVRNLNYESTIDIFSTNAYTRRHGISQVSDLLFWIISSVAKQPF